MKKTQKGFTLIELVIVIVILGILAAFIIPRFGALDKQARISVVQGMAGSLRGATAIVHGVYLANGIPSAAQVLLDGVPVSVSNGYPVADGSATGILAALNQTFTAGTSGTIGTLSFSVATGVVTLYPSSAPGTVGAGCNVTYTNSSITSAGKVASVTTGC